jgi:hypothetical protein
LPDGEVAIRAVLSPRFQRFLTFMLQTGLRLEGQLRLEGLVLPSAKVQTINPRWQVAGTRICRMTRATPDIFCAEVHSV